MHAHLDEYPPAPEERVAEAKALFPYQSMHPEEYAAREGHRWVCFSFDEYIYPDPELNTWLHSLGDIFASGALSEPRRQYLSPLEIADIEREESGDGL